MHATEKLRTPCRRTAADRQPMRRCRRSQRHRTVQGAYAICRVLLSNAPPIQWPCRPPGAPSGTKPLDPEGVISRCDQRLTFARGAPESRRTKDGAVAHLVERLNGIQEVRGSTPLSSTILRPPAVGWAPPGPNGRRRAAPCSFPFMRLRDQARLPCSIGWKWGAIPPRDRRCDRGRTSQDATALWGQTSPTAWEGAEGERSGSQKTDR